MFKTIFDLRIRTETQSRRERSGCGETINNLSERHQVNKADAKHFCSEVLFKFPGLMMKYVSKDVMLKKTKIIIMFFLNISDFSA